MAQERLRLRLLLGALAACLSFAAHPAGKDLKTPKTPWGQLSPQDQQVLAPLAPDWDKLPGYQQQRLQSAARQYPKMRPIQQERFQERIRDWASMTPEQRKAARETFQGLRKLPPSKQHELRGRWLERNAAPPPAPSPAPGGGPESRCCRVCPRRRRRSRLAAPSSEEMARIRPGLARDFLRQAGCIPR